MPPIVLLHGASGCAATWTPTLPHWGEQEVVAIDLPGRGESQAVAPIEAAAGVAAWLRGELARRGLERPVLVGHSFGGAVALEVALAAPGEISGVVMVSSAARLRVAPVILDAVAAATPDAPFRLDFAFAKGCPEAVRERYHADAAGVPTAAGLADWRACDGFDVRARLGEVGVPALVLWGSEDALTIPRFQAGLVEALPDATGQELPGIGHMLPWEAPQALADAVASWLAGR